jgi:hypothetical protein
MGEGDLAHKVLAVAEEEGAERAAYALKLLQSEGSLSIASTGKDNSTVIVVPLAEARSWAADVYAAVTIAYREHTGDPSALSDYELAAMPDPGRVVFESLAGRWHQPDPEVLRLRAELGLDDGANGSSSLGSSG